MMPKPPREAVQMSECDLPMKSKLLLQYYDGEAIWDYDSIDALLKSEGKEGSDYWKWTARFWLKELYINGFVEIVEEDLDDGSHFAKDKAVTKYRVTDYGKTVIDGMLR